VYVKTELFMALVQAKAKSHSLTGLVVTRLPNLNARADAEVILPLTVEERRHPIDHNRANVDVLAGVDVYAAAERHRKCRVGLLVRGQTIVKVCAHVRYAEQRVRKRRRNAVARIETRPDHQIVTLHARIEDAATVQIGITRLIKASREAGHDADVAVDVLIELSGEAVVAHALVGEIDRRAVESCAALSVKVIGVVERALMRIAYVELIERVVSILRKRARCANGSDQEQEKKSGHSGRLLVDAAGFELKDYRYINTANREKIPRFFGKLCVFW